MSHPDAFDLYRLFILSKAFLSSKKKDWTYVFQYTRFGYNRVKLETFENLPYRRYFYVFEKKKISDEKFVRLCACANHVKGKKFWIYDLISNDTLEFYKNLQSFLDNFIELSKQELSNIDIPKNRLLGKGINYPMLLELFIQKKISLPLLIAFERQYNILEKENESRQNQFGALRYMWDMYYTNIKKWNGFFFEGEIPDIVL